MRRSAVTASSNIAEGYGRRITQYYIYSCYVAYGSLCELETQLVLSIDLGYFNNKNFSQTKESLREMERMHKALIKLLEQKNKPDHIPLLLQPLDSLNHLNIKNAN